MNSVEPLQPNQTEVQCGSHEDSAIPSRPKSRSLCWLPPVHRSPKTAQVPSPRGGMVPCQPKSTGPGRPPQLVRP